MMVSFQDAPIEKVTIAYEVSMDKHYSYDVLLNLC